MKLAYQAVNKSGQIVSSHIEAHDAMEATDLLRKEGLFVTEVSEAVSQAGGMGTKRRARGRIKMKHVAMFTRQLSVLVSTGTPLVESIGALARQTKNEAWEAVVTDIRDRLEDGISFSKALEAHPQQFDSVYRSLVGAGETGGNLDEMLARLSQLTRQRMHIKNIVVGALAYPSILILIAVAVLGILIGFVLPRFADLFATLNASLPPTTKLLMFISEVAKTYWWAVLMSLVGLGGCITMIIKSQTGKRVIDVVSLNLPVFGPIVRSFATARMTRLLGILMNSRVPLLDALKLTREGSSSFRFSQMIQEAEDAVTRGENISTIMSRSPLIDATVAEAVRCGEQTGEMGTVMLSIADFLDEDNEVILKSLSSIIEPVILIVLGVLVGIVAVSMFMPLFDITAAVPGGGG